MKYTKEDLINMPVGKLIEIIEKMQEENDNAEWYKRRLARIAAIATGEPNAEEERRGRPAFTPEQKAESYERYKAKKREQYAQMKALKAAADKELPLPTEEIAE